MTTDLWRLSATQLLEGYARHDFAPSEVLEECLGRIDVLNPQLHAYLAINAEDARNAAGFADRRWRLRGEKPTLLGVPVSVKDTIEMRGMPTTYGSLAFRENYQQDSEIVRRLRDAGAVIIGKTNTSEFALLAKVENRLGDPGRNPWNLEHSCGGSSGGAAAAVAAGLGQLAVGTDSGGSIRQPAAHNGIFGLKPSFQRIPTVQFWRAAPGRSHNGPLARTVRDGALLMQVLAGMDGRDPESAMPPEADFLDFTGRDLRGTRVAISRSLGGNAQADSEEIAVLQAAADLLRERDCHIVDDDPPFPQYSNNLEPGVWGYSGDHYAAAEALMADFWEKHADDLTGYARPVYDAGRGALAWQYRRLLRQCEKYRETVTHWFRDYDFLMTPVAGPAPPCELESGPADGPVLPFLSPFNLSRNPAASVPAGMSRRGLPLAVQIVGRSGDDLGVLRMAAAIESAVSFVERWPPLAETCA